LDQLVALEQLAANSASKAPELKCTISDLEEFQERLRSEQESEAPGSLCRQIVWQFSELITPAAYCATVG
jgi:hypothetical protein